jgi:hypothetical protein
MKSKPTRPSRPSDENREVVDEILGRMFAQARGQFGNAVKSFWFYEDDLCPGCLARPIGAIKMKGKKAVAINAFIYRPRGVLIGYFLCQVCATYIFEEAQKNPYKQTPLHADIERNLIAAYHTHLASLDA